MSPLPTPVFNCAPAVRIKSSMSAGCSVLNITGNMEVVQAVWPFINLPLALNVLL